MRERLRERYRKSAEGAERGERREVRMDQW